MKIGMTYDLREEYLAAGYGEEETAEFDRPDTIDAIAGALTQLGHDPDRIGSARRLVERLAGGDRWDLVFNICEGLAGAGREAQVPAILDVYEIPYVFSDPAVMCVCLDKWLAKLVVRDAGVSTAPCALVTGDEFDAVAIRAQLAGPELFVKPVAEGTAKGIGPASRVKDAAQLEARCRQLLKQFRQPVLVEPFLSGREFTVGVLGTGAAAEILGTLEVIPLPGAEAGIHSYVNKERCEELVEYRLGRPDGDDEVARAESLSLAAWRALGCRDGGRIDVRCDEEGRPHFLEANPLSGLHPSHSDLPILCTALGMPYLDLIRRIVDSAIARARLGAPAGAATA